METNMSAVFAWIRNGLAVFLACSAVASPSDCFAADMDEVFGQLKFGFAKIVKGEKVSLRSVLFKEQTETAEPERPRQETYTVAVPYTEMVEQTYTVMVPYTETIKEDGKEKTVTKSRPEQRTRAVPVTKTRMETRTRLVSGRRTAAKQLDVEVGHEQLSFFDLAGEKLEWKTVAESLQKKTPVLLLRTGASIPEVAMPFLKDDLIVVRPSKSTQP